MHRLAALLVTLTLFSACTAGDRTSPAAKAGSPPHSAARDGVQTIIKMKDRSVRVDDAAVLSRLQTLARADIAFVRPMSDEAFVIRVLPRSGDDYDAVLARLQADPGVLYVERDQIVKIQSR